MGSIGAAELIVVGLFFLVVIGVALVVVILAIRRGRSGAGHGSSPALWPCRACGKPISPRAAVCPQCGEPRSASS
jgi:hypothetical protein